MIIKIEPSKVKNKRYTITMDNGKTYNFGQKGAHTYIDHHNLKLRNEYHERHLGNDTENKLISHLVPSPSLFSFYILWGPHKTVGENINYLNNLWFKKHNT